jgi:DNA-binding CsgD family transcriptional regulator
MTDERAVAGALADLVGAIGTADFPARFHRAFSGLARIDLCSAFLRDRREPLRLLFAEGEHPAIPGFSLRASLDYSRAFWRSDRRLTALARQPRKAPIVVRTAATDIADPAWRAACYESADVAERISIVASGPPAIIANGYRFSGGDGPGPADIERLDRYAPLFVAALERHARAGAATRPMLNEAELAQSLMALRYGLSTREAEISAAMMLGETQDEIASRKRLSYGSVVTYRRRAYGKLGISNRRGLLRLHLRLMAGRPPAKAPPAGGLPPD